MRVLGWLLSCLVLAHSAFAQVTVVSTDPPEGAVSVPLEKKVVFKLNKGLPAFGSQFADKFIWSPEDSTRLSTFGHDCESTGPCAPPPLILVFFTLDHTPNTDFSFIAYGVQADDGSRMARPFVLNYTTAATRGPHQVSGTAAFGSRTGKAMSAERQQLVQSLAQLRAGLAEPLRQTRAQQVGAEQPAAPPTAIRSLASSDINRTVVLLMDAYTLDDNQWAVRAAAVPDENGAFTFEGIRDGRYWPVAISYATEDGEVVGAYGFYDADSDAVPDAIDVNGAVNGVDLTLFNYQPFEPQETVALAEAQAAAFSTEQRLISVRAAGNLFASPIEPDGSALLWRYTFYDPIGDRVTNVDIDPINVAVSTRLPLTGEAEQEALVDGFLGSRAALAVAEQNGGAAFRDQHGDDIFVTMQAGDLPLAFRPPPPRQFWLVSYLSGFVEPVEELDVFVDLETGDLLNGVFVSNEDETVVPSQVRLLPNSPNPVVGQTTMRYELSSPMWTSMAVYNALGQRVVVLREGEQAAGTHTLMWDASNQPPGVYFVRLHTARAVQTRAMIVR